MERSVLIATASAVSASTLTFLFCRYLARRRQAQENVYDTEKLLGEYLVFHFGKADELLPYGLGPRESLEFPTRCALECVRYTQDDVPSIALDIGCAVGGSSFELARKFNHVVGIDFSYGFIEACNRLKVYGKLSYTVQTEGSLVSEHVAEVDPDIDRSRLSFFQGDACNLPRDLGQFGCVLAANLVCRLSNPYKFLDRLPSLVAPGGILVITSPYSWLEEFTSKSLWLGGYKDASGKIVTGFDTLKSYLGPSFELLEDKPMPFFIRETAHKNQWTVAHATIWKRRKST